MKIVRQLNGSNNNNGIATWKIKSSKINLIQKSGKVLKYAAFTTFLLGGKFIERQYYHDKLQLRKEPFMYDISKRRECKNMKVWEAIEILCKMPLNAKVLFNGDEYGYLHIEEDESAISFDDSSLDDEYENSSL